MIKGLAMGLAAAGAAAMLWTAGQAEAAVTVTGDGFAKACSEAAKAGQSAYSYEEICTAALGDLLPARDRAGTYVNRGIIKLRRQAYAEAIKDFDTAIRYQPDLAETYVNRGAADIGVRRFPDSIADLNKALALGVQEPEKAYYNRAVAYEWMDKVKAAYLDYQKALELAPDWDLVKQQLARFTVSHAEARAPAAPTHP
jgi:tetratricopeptide (TPR) repeat protein